MFYLNNKNFSSMLKKYIYNIYYQFLAMYLLMIILPETQPMYLPKFMFGSLFLFWIYGVHLYNIHLYISK